MASKFKVAFKSNAGTVKGIVVVEQDGATTEEARSFLEAAVITAVKSKAVK